MGRFIWATTNDSEVKLAYKLRTRSSTLIPKLADKMFYLMTKLQEKAQANSGLTSNRVRESIRDPRAEVQGGRIIGTLDWGGVDVSYKATTGGKGIIYDLAQIFEKGQKEHAINALTERGSRTPQGRFGGKLKSVRRYGANVLQWFNPPGSNNAVYAQSVFHPGREGIHFMENAVQEMKEDFADGLQGVVYDTLG